ncbi:ABC transporter permease [Flexivirga oryzae]|uniref:Osmoprotectant transport system permease protein n=1 Tax=Flexivirga oryzae TaxID=1794944 RepID=A0A839N8D2_9MICO|nr:ABC transporter permease [Flexivirga oryzae]MBB2894028.1 osmoprotectant transport system permease protein [Flexivirga oryzae]
MIGQVWRWLIDGANWQGSTGITHRLLEHLEYTGESVLIAAVIALPIGAVIGHSGRGKWILSAANAFRAIPSLGLLFVVAMWFVSRLTSDAAYLVPTIVVLVILAIPPLLAGAYSGVSEVDPAARDAAFGMGMTGPQVLARVELPCALPLIFSGLRSAALQVIATATIAAAISVGGLGRYLIDGLANSDYVQMAGGAILVAALALVVDGVLAALQRLLVPGGLRSARPSRHKRRAAVAEARSAPAA